MMVIGLVVVLTHRFRDDEGREAWGHLRIPLVRTAAVTASVAGGAGFGGRRRAEGGHAAERRDRADDQGSVGGIADRSTEVVNKINYYTSSN